MINKNDDKMINGMNFTKKKCAPATLNNNRVNLYKVFRNDLSNAIIFVLYNMFYFSKNVY